MKRLKIDRCPTCGSRRIRRVKRDVRGTFRGKPYVAKAVEFEECSNCGERLYDLEAMRKLEAARSSTRRRKPAA